MLAARAIKKAPCQRISLPPHPPRQGASASTMREADLSFLILSIYALVLSIATRMGRRRLSGA